MSRPATGRKLQMIDLMLFTVAVGIGFAWARESAVARRGFSFYGNKPSGLFLSLIHIREIFAVTVRISFLVTLALVLLRWLPPRPPSRRLACQPGFVAGLMVSMALLPFFIEQVAIGIMTQLVYGGQQPFWNGMTIDAEPGFHEVGRSATFAGVAVAGAWLILRLGRRWRPEATWIDQFGRFLGAFWIAVIPWQFGFEILWVLGMSGKI